MSTDEPKLKLDAKLPTSQASNVPRVAIVGGGGRVGSRLVAMLAPAADAGLVALRVVTRSAAVEADVEARIAATLDARESKAEPTIEIVSAPVHDEQALANACAGCDVVVNATASETLDPAEIGAAIARAALAANAHLIDTSWTWPPASAAPDGEPQSTATEKPESPAEPAHPKSSGKDDEVTATEQRARDVVAAEELAREFAKRDRAWVTHACGHPGLSGLLARELVRRELAETESIKLVWFEDDMPGLTIGAALDALRVTATRPAGVALGKVRAFDVREDASVFDFGDVVGEREAVPIACPDVASLARSTGAANAAIFLAGADVPMRVRETRGEADLTRRARRLSHAHRRRGVMGTALRRLFRRGGAMLLIEAAGNRPSSPSARGDRRVEDDDGNGSVRPDSDAAKPDRMYASIRLGLADTAAFAALGAWLATRSLLARDAATAPGDSDEAEPPPRAGPLDRRACALFAAGLVGGGTFGGSSTAIASGCSSLWETPIPDDVFEVLDLIGDFDLEIDTR